MTREFYKGKGTFGQKNHDDYYKPEEYFEDRHEGGMIGLAVYGSLLAINICDILLCCASVYVCRDLTRSEQVQYLVLRKEVVYVRAFDVLCYKIMYLLYLYLRKKFKLFKIELKQKQSNCYCLHVHVFLVQSNPTLRTATLY